MDLTAPQQIRGAEHWTRKGEVKLFLWRKAPAAATGVEVSLSTPEKFAAFVRAEHEKWGKVVRDTGATVN